METTITVETLTGVSPLAGNRSRIMRSKEGKMKPTQLSKPLAPMSYIHTIAPNVTHVYVLSR